MQSRASPADFTVEEEIGLAGAKNLDPSVFDVKYVINVDGFTGKVDRRQRGGSRENLSYRGSADPQPEDEKFLPAAVSALELGLFDFRRRSFRL